MVVLDVPLTTVMVGVTQRTREGQVVRRAERERERARERARERESERAKEGGRRQKTEEWKEGRECHEVQRDFT